eukprot:TCONS_00059846-protein
MVNTCESRFKLVKVLRKLNTEYQRTRDILSSKALEVAILGDGKKIDKRMACLKTIEIPTEEDIFTEKPPAKLIGKHYLRLNFNKIVLEVFNKELQNGFPLLNTLPTEDGKIEKLREIQNEIQKRLKNQTSNIEKQLELFKDAAKINGLDIALTEQQAFKLKIKLQFIEMKNEKEYSECFNEFARLRQFFNNLRYFYEDFIADGKVRIRQCRLFG